MFDPVCTETKHGMYKFNVTKRENSTSRKTYTWQASSFGSLSCLRILDKEPLFIRHFFRRFRDQWGRSARNDQRGRVFCILPKFYQFRNSLNPCSIAHHRPNRVNFPNLTLLIVSLSPSIADLTCLPNISPACTSSHPSPVRRQPSSHRPFHLLCP